MAINLMGGRSIDDGKNQATETAIRGMYKYYRTVMGY